MFSRIAVINRGEPAVRLIRAVRELNSEVGYGIKVIALHTAAERGALFVRAADEGVLLRDKGDLGSPYLDHAELERAMIAGKLQNTPQNLENWIVDPQAVRSWVEAMTAPPQLVRMPDTSHFFHRKLLDLRGAIKHGVRAYLPAASA